MRVRTRTAYACPQCHHHEIHSQLLRGIPAEQVPQPHTYRLEQRVPTQPFNWEEVWPNPAQIPRLSGQADLYLLPVNAVPPHWVFRVSHPEKTNHCLRDRTSCSTRHSPKQPNPGSGTGPASCAIWNTHLTCPDSFVTLKINLLVAFYWP